MEHTGSAAGWLRGGAWNAACALLAAVALLLSAGAALDGTWIKALAWFACAAVGAGAIMFRRILPPFFGLLLTLSALVNTAGYVFNLWHERTSFDEVVHAFTFFAGTSAVGWFILRRRPYPDGLFWKTALMALVLGLAWEGFEWLIGIVGDTRDTVIDLLMDTIGALAAAALLRRVDPSNRSILHSRSSGDMRPLSLTRHRTRRLRVPD